MWNSERPQPKAVTRKSDPTELMNPHKQIVTAAFVVAGLYFGFTGIRDFDSILAANRTFFDTGPAWQANAGTAIITLVPLAFFATSFAVFRGARWWIAAAPALIAVLLTLGPTSIVLGAYLVLYYSVLIEAEKATGAGAD